MTYRHYLITQRKSWALSQLELGLLLGLSRSAVSNYECQFMLPSFQMAMRLEIIFGKTPGRLFPALYDENEEAVMRAAAGIRAKLEGKTDLSSVRKRELLDEMMRRATHVPAV